MKTTGDKVQLTPALQALADATRWKILLMLEGKPRTVGEIVSFFELSQPTITRHLQSLAKAGLVVRRKEAQRVIYAVNPDTIQKFCIELVGCFPCCSVAVAKIETTASKHSDRLPANHNRSQGKNATRHKRGGQS